jgi:hypothetical protein
MNNLYLSQLFFSKTTMDVNDDGRRMAKLRQILDKALDTAVQDAAKQDFSSAYAPNLKISPPQLMHLTNSMLQNIASNVKVRTAAQTCVKLNVLCVSLANTCKTEFTALCQDHDVNGKLNLLDSMIKDQPISTRTGQRRSYRNN